MPPATVSSDVEEAVTHTTGAEGPPGSLLGHTGTCQLVTQDVQCASRPPHYFLFLSSRKPWFCLLDSGPEADLRAEFFDVLASVRGEAHPKCLIFAPQMLQVTTGPLASCEPQHPKSVLLGRQPCTRQLGDSPLFRIQSLFRIVP